MGIKTVAEFGRWVQDYSDGDPSILLDTTADPREFPLSGLYVDRPRAYNMWRVTLEELTNRNGSKVVDYAINIRLWRRAKPSDSYPEGWEGPVGDKQQGGITLKSGILTNLMPAIVAAYDACMLAEEQRLATPDPADTIASLQAEIARLKRAAGE